MRHVTLRDLESFTGKHRTVLKERLQGIPFTPGPNRAHIYDSERALEAIYVGSGEGTLDEARRKQALAIAELNQVRSEELRKIRIPIDIVSEAHDQVLQSIAATLKAHCDKVLTRTLINEIFAQFRDIPRQLKWPGLPACAADPPFSPAPDVGNSR